MKGISIHKNFNLFFTRRVAARSLFMLASLAALCAVVMAPPAKAIVISGNSAAYDVSIDLNVDFSTFIETALGIAGIADAALQVNIGGTPLVSGLAPTPYNSNDGVVSISADSGGGTPIIMLDASGAGDVVSANAQSDVDDTSGNRSASALAEVQSLSLSATLNTGILGLGILDLFSIDASSGTLRSNSQVSGQFSALSSTGSSFIENATLNLLGQIAALDLSATAATAPNTQISPIPGLVSIIINEQTTGGNGSDTANITTNALHINFGAGITLQADFGTLVPNIQNIATITGDVIISHTEAALVAVVPAPATWLLFGTGLLCLAGVRQYFKDENCFALPLNFQRKT